MISRIVCYLHDHAAVLQWVFFAFLAFSVVFDFFVHRHAPHFWGDAIIGFWSLLGIVGCLGMIVICKGISHCWLMKSEDYYDD